MRVRKTRYSTYNINYHIVWIPKYRRKVLVGEVANSLKNMFDRIGYTHCIDVLEMEVMPDHVHLFVSAPPRYPPAWIVNTFKGCSARWLREWFPHLKDEIHGSLWTRTYYIGTAGTVTAETIAKYIEEQTAHGSQSEE